MVRAKLFSPYTSYVFLPELLAVLHLLPETLILVCLQKNPRLVFNVLSDDSDQGSANSGAHQHRRGAGGTGGIKALKWTQEFVFEQAPPLHGSQPRDCVCKPLAWDLVDQNSDHSLVPEYSVETGYVSLDFPLREGPEEE